MKTIGLILFPRNEFLVNWRCRVNFHLFAFPVCLLFASENQRLHQPAIGVIDQTIVNNSSSHHHSEKQKRNVNVNEDKQYLCNQWHRIKTMEISNVLFGWYCQIFNEDIWYIPCHWNEILNDHDQQCLTKLNDTYIEYILWKRVLFLYITSEARFIIKANIIT